MEEHKGGRLEACGVVGTDKCGSSQTEPPLWWLMGSEPHLSGDSQTEPLSPWQLMGSKPTLCGCSQIQNLLFAVGAFLHSESCLPRWHSFQCPCGGQGASQWRLQAAVWRVPSWLPHQCLPVHSSYK